MALDYTENVFEKAYTTGMLVLTNQDMEEFPDLQGKFDAETKHGLRGQYHHYFQSRTFHKFGSWTCLAIAFNIFRLPY